MSSINRRMDLDILLDKDADIFFDVNINNNINNNINKNVNMKKDNDDSIKSISTDMSSLSISPKPDTKDRNTSKRNNICLYCLKDVDGILTCSRCRTARYCSRSCQVSDWKSTHKDICIDSNNDYKAEKMRLKARNYVKQGNFYKAHHLWCKLYDMMRNAYGENHSWTMDARYNLAGVLHDLGDYQQAEGHFRHLWEFGMQTNNKSRDTLSAMHGTGISCDMQGKKEEAMELFKRCLELRIISLGPDDCDTLLVMHSYGVVLIERCRYDDAEEVLLECLARQRKGFASGEGMVKRSEILHSLNTLANCYCGQEKYIEAESFARQCIDESKRVFGGNHPQNLNYTHNLANVLANNGKLEEAEALQKECIEKRKLTLGDKHPLYFTSFASLGMILKTNNRLDEAEAILKKCSDRERKVLGESVNYLKTMINLADIYDVTKRRADAQKMYKECYYKLKKIVGESNISTNHARDGLIRSYDKDDKVAERSEFFNAIGLRSLTEDEAVAVSASVLQNLTGDDYKDMLNGMKTETLSPQLEKLIIATANKILFSR